MSSSRSAWPGASAEMENEGGGHNSATRRSERLRYATSDLFPIGRPLSVKQRGSDRTAQTAALIVAVKSDTPSSAPTANNHRNTGNMRIEMVSRAAQISTLQ